MLDKVLNTKHHIPQEFEEDLGKIAMGIVIWSTFYFIIKATPLHCLMPNTNLTTKQDLDLRNRIVSFFHGFLAMLAGGYHFI